MKRYPKSFVQLVTFGHFVVAIPLLIVAVYAYLTLEKLASHYEVVVDDVSVASRLIGKVSEGVVHLDLSLRRHQVLKDAESLVDYEMARQEWQQDLARLARLSIMTDRLKQEFTAQQQLEADAFEAMTAQKNFAPLMEAISALNQRSALARAELEQLIQTDLNETRQVGDQLSRHLMIGVAVAGTLAFTSLWFMRWLLRRLIGRFERAVLSLGRGELQKPISLDGPGDLRWLGRWLEWLRKRLLSLETARAQVLRHVSHELKTPLAAMQEGTALLSEGVSGPLTREQQHIVGIVQTNVRRLQDLIDGLLRLQQAGHAAERIGHETLAYDEIVQQVIDTHRLIALERNISLMADIAPVSILAGHEALLTIVHNLISNAVKYSPVAGQINIRLSQVAEMAILEVDDQGPGIPDEELSMLFEPFFRGSQARQTAGVGLGLAIAREFVLALKGEILVANRPEGGACFTVRLPVNAPYLRKSDHA